MKTYKKFDAQHNLRFLSYEKSTLGFNIFLHYALPQISNIFWIEMDPQVFTKKSEKSPQRVAQLLGQKRLQEFGQMAGLIIHSTFQCMINPMVISQALPFFRIKFETVIVKTDMSIYDWTYRHGFMGTKIVKTDRSIKNWTNRLDFIGTAKVMPIGPIFIGPIGFVYIGFPSVCPNHPSIRLP